MKTIQIDDELYHYIASRTQAIGESASDILRRLLRLPASPQPFVLVQENMINELKELAKPRSEIKESKPVSATPSAPKKQSANDLERTVVRVETVLKSNEFIDETRVVGRFLMLLTALYRSNPESFSRATEHIQGSERLYFARDEATILASGSSVKAKQIPESPFWVITNNNTARKGQIVTQLMDAMQLPKDLIERIRALFV